MPGAHRLRQNRAMPNESVAHVTAAPGRRSSIEQLPAEVRDAVDEAIAAGAGNDEITALIRARGGNCSRSAVGRYAKRVRGRIRRQREADRITELWARVFGKSPDSPIEDVAIESLRGLTLLTSVDLSVADKTVTADQVSRLALALRRIEDTDRQRIRRERSGANTGPGRP